MKENNLIKNYIKNNQLDIEEIIQNYTPYIYTIIRNKNSNISNEDIEEIISDVFLVTWKNQEKLDVNKELSSYLAKIAKNLYNKKLRNTRNDIDIDDYINILFEEESIELKIENTEREHLIYMLVNNMKPEDKDIFTLYYYNSMTMKQISKILNITEKKIKSRLFRIRKKIRKHLDNGGV